MGTKKLHIFSAAGFVALIQVALLSWTGQAWGDYARMREEIAQFHAFMIKHPKVSTDLQNDPQLVNDRKYLDRHEEVKQFLKEHPAVRREIAEHPRRVFGRYYIDDRHEYFDNRPEHRWDYRYHERWLDRRDYRGYR